MSVLSRKTSLISQKYVILDCKNNICGCGDDLYATLSKARNMATTLGKTMYIYNRHNDEVFGSAFPREAL